MLVTYLLCGIGMVFQSVRCVKMNTTFVRAPTQAASHAIAGSAAAFLLTSSPRAALVGASGSVFGLFVVSVLTKLSQFNLRRLV